MTKEQLLADFGNPAPNADFMRVCAREPRLHAEYDCVSHVVLGLDEAGKDVLCVLIVGHFTERRSESAYFRIVLTEAEMSEFTYNQGKCHDLRALMQYAQNKAVIILDYKNDVSAEYPISNVPEDYLSAEGLTYKNIIND